MASNFTLPIETGISFPNFVLRCATAFGEPYQLIDSSFPKEYIPDSSYKVDLEKAQKKLSETEKMKLKDIQKIINANYAIDIVRYNDTINNRKNLLVKYNAMLKLVLEWTPPERLNNLKNFMIKQIEESIEFDCSDRSAYKPVKVSAKYWKENEILCDKRQIQYLTERIEASEKSCETKNNWLNDLRKSIEGYDYRYV